MLRAMWWLRLAGKIDKETHRRIKAAVWSGMPIAAGNFTPKPIEGKTFIQAMRREVGIRMNTKQKRVSEGRLDEIFETLSFDAVVTWILENWQLIVQLAMGLFVLLDAGYEAE